MRGRIWTICAAALACAVPASTATALEPPSHELIREIAPGDPSAGGPLKDACGIAVDPVDNLDRLFIANYYGHEIAVFKRLPEEKFELEATIPVKQPPLAPNGKPVNGPCDLAIDSKGNLYVNRWHYDVLRYPRLSPSAPLYGPPSVIDSNGSTSVTVDSVDHVFVDDRTYVAEYEPSGAPVLEGGEPVRIGLGSLGDGYGVAVSEFKGSPGFAATAGWVYVADGADNTVKVYKPGGDPSLPDQTIDGGGTPQLGFRRLVDADVAVDPVDGHIYVVDNLQPFFEQPEAVLDEFNSLGYFREAVPFGVNAGNPSGLIHGEPSAVATYKHNVYLTSGNYFDDNDAFAKPFHEDSRALIYGPPATVETQMVSVTRSGAGSGMVFSSSPAGLGCGDACENEFLADRTVILKAVPAAHSRFVGWTGCVPLAEAPSQCALTMDEDHVVDAEFEPLPPRQLSVAVSSSAAGSGTVLSIPAGIDCGAVCAGEFDEGSAVTLAATPGAGASLASWSGCDSNPSPLRCTVTMNAARVVQALFVGPGDPPPPKPTPPEQRTLSVVATGTGSATGTVTSAPGGIDCGRTCAHAYGRGTGVTVVARPAPGARFLGWGGCDSATGDRCGVSLGDDKTVVAAFGPGSPGPLRLQGVAVRGATATLRLTVPAAGALSASGRNLLPASALPLAAGKASLKLQLNGAGRRALAGAGRGGLRVKVALALAPFDGGDVVQTRKTVVFGAEPRRGKVGQRGGGGRG
jgi:hypothetical protein